MKVKLRATLEIEYEVDLPSPAYEGAETALEAAQVDAKNDPYIFMQVMRDSPLLGRASFEVRPSGTEPGAVFEDEYGERVTLRYRIDDLGAWSCSWRGDRESPPMTISEQTLLTRWRRIS